jgi:hypothetical protein
VTDHGRTASGKPLTDKLITELATEAEHGYDVDAILTRRAGRPTLGTSAATVESVRLDPELRDALLRRAEADHTTPSALIREALRRYLNVA